MKSPQLFQGLGGLSISFGGVHAVRDGDLDVSRGEILGLTESNSAGKTTIRGLGEAMSGINVDEIPQPHRRAERGW